MNKTSSNSKGVFTTESGKRLSYTIDNVEYLSAEKCSQCKTGFCAMQTNFTRTISIEILQCDCNKYPERCPKCPSHIRCMHGDDCFFDLVGGIKYSDPERGQGHLVATLHKLGRYRSKTVLDFIHCNCGPIYDTQNLAPCHFACDIDGDHINPKYKPCNAVLDWIPFTTFDKATNSAIIHNYRLPELKERITIVKNKFIGLHSNSSYDNTQTNYQQTGFSNNNTIMLDGQMTYILPSFTKRGFHS